MFAKQPEFHIRIHKNWLESIKIGRNEDITEVSVIGRKSQSQASFWLSGWLGALLEWSAASAESLTLIREHATI